MAHGKHAMLNLMNGWATVAALVGLATTTGCVERLLGERGQCKDGTFGPGDICFGEGEGQRYVTPDLTPISIRGADFTGDGVVDVLVMGNDASGIVAGRTLVGNGDGQLLPPIDAGLAGCSAHPVPGAIDTEAPTDLLVDECDESVSLFLGTNQGSFDGPANVFVGARTRSSGLIDLTQDRRVEVVVLGSAADESPVLSVSFPAEGGAVPPVTIAVSNVGTTPFNPTGFGIANSDRDDARVVLIDPTVVDGLAIMDHPLLGDRVERLPVGFTPSGAAVADFDADGDDELLVTALELATLVVFEIDEPGAPPRQIGSTPSDITPLARQIIDVDDDGHLDLAIAEATSTGVSIWRGRGDGTFEEPLLVDVGLVPEQFFLADLNGDDAPDLVAANFAEGEFVVFIAEP